MHANSSSFDIDTQPYDLLEAGDAFCSYCGRGQSWLGDRCPEDGGVLIRAHRYQDRRIGCVIDARYRIVRPLGEGAMGVVYEAVQLSVKRRVAIKVIRDEMGRDPSAARRFLREARLLTSIAHPHVVEVFDYGETDDGSLYLVMELLRGEPLDAILVHEGAFSVKRTCIVGMQLCDALSAAHAKGVVHRDLKPANVVLIPGLGDWVKVLDFGLAKNVGDPAGELTVTGALIGTPLYMAPEAIRCDGFDMRSDLYALGCVLHELLTGRAPFVGETSVLVLARQLDDAPPPLPAEVPAELRKLVFRLLAKSATDRPSSAIEVRAALQACLEDIDTPAY